MGKTGKIMGVIGGMGPLATQLFYGMVIENTAAERDQDHIDMVILSHATLPDRTEAIETGRTDELLSELEKDAALLENAGACCIVIPCNTCHVIIDELRERTKLPVINMIKAAADHVKARFGEAAKVGIMATDGTIEAGLYQKECGKLGLDPVIPSEEDQRTVMSLIYDGIKKNGSIDYDDFRTVEEGLRGRGCDCVIMACTELSVIKRQYGLSGYFVDAMEAAAREAIVCCGKELRV